MNINPLLVGHVKDTDEIYGIAAKRVRSRIEAAILDEKIVVARARFQESRQQVGQRRAPLLVLLFKRSAEYSREIAYILGHEKVSVHEAFDRAARIFVGESHETREVGLYVER